MLIHALAMLALTSASDESSEIRAVAPAASLAVGYAIPIGSLFKSETINVNNAMKGGFPITLEAGVALWETWHMVAYAGYAWLDRSERCLPTSDCSGASLRFGGQVQWWAPRYHEWAGFIGLGGGWEQLTLDSNQGSLTFSGFEGVVILGALYQVGKVGIGPYVEGTLGAYSQLNAAIGGGTGSETIRNQALHGWLIIGVRVDLWL